MNRYYLFCSFFLSILLFLPSNSKCENPVSVDWVVNAQKNAFGTYSNEIRIICCGDKELAKEWTIYFCAFARKFELAPDSPIRIERIAGTYHKIEPTSYFSCLSHGDTLQVAYKTPWPCSTISFTPAKAYFVERCNGKEIAPCDVPVHLIYQCTNTSSVASQDSTAITSESYFSNLSLCPQIDLSVYDIIPKVKKIDFSKSHQKTFRFTDDVKIISEPRFYSENQILKEWFQSKNCTISAKGKTLIYLEEDKRLSKLHPDAYRIKIEHDRLVIQGASRCGIFYGVQTLLSVLSSQSLPLSLSLPLAQLTDYPDLRYRGLMLDVSRNFTNKTDLLRLIDAMASYKLNRLHLHLSDDEGWRVEIPGLEELTEVGSRRGHTLDESRCLIPTYFADWNADDANASGNGFYSRADFVEILRYATKRHICVIPEFDLPGHSRAAIVSMKARYERYRHTDLQKASEYLLSESADTSNYLSGQGYNDNVINVALPSSYRFVQKVFEEIKRMYRDADLSFDVVHVGGDEVAAGAWTGSPLCRKQMDLNMMSKARELKDYFLQQVITLLQPMNIRLAGWQEIVLRPHSAEMDTRFQSYQPISYCWSTIHKGYDEMPYVLANAGFDVVLCNASNFYLDFAYDNLFYEPGHNWGGYVDEFRSFDAQPYNFYESMRHVDKGRRTVSIDRQAKLKLTDFGRKHLLGMQAQLWCETVNSFDKVGYYIFPKILGLVERCWNSEPIWSKLDHSSEIRQVEYEQDLLRFNTVCNRHELPKLQQMGLNFRICAPELMIQNGMLYANCRIVDAVIRYTTDGSEPDIHSRQWTKPLPCCASHIRAKAFYLGKESVCAELKR